MNHLENMELKHCNFLRRSLSECMVLLKSDGSFPLVKPCKIALYGNGARETLKGGTGSGEVNTFHDVNVEQGLENAGFTITTKQWLDAYSTLRRQKEKAFINSILSEGDNAVLTAMGKTMKEPEYDLPLDGKGDAALYVLSRQSGEGADRTFEKGDVLLTDTEVHDILALNKQFSVFMLVLNTGGVVDLSPVKDIKNILIMSQIGSEGGSVLADVLLGKQYPSGHLAATWSAVEDYNKDTDFGEKDDTVYKEGIHVGYRYFEGAGKKPLFPFGYGLGYTTFVIHTDGLSGDEKRAVLKGTVANTGERCGKEVVQVYLSYLSDRNDERLKVLAGWYKTKELQPGETEAFEIPFSLMDNATYDENLKQWVLEDGSYGVYVGNDCMHTVKAGSIDLDHKIVIPLEIHHKAEDPRMKQLTELSEETLAEICTGSFDAESGEADIIGNAASAVAGAAGQTVSIDNFTGNDQKILKQCGMDRPLIMADGPAGLRLAKDYYEDEDGAHAIGSGLPSSTMELMDENTRKQLEKKPPAGAEIRHHICTALPIGTAIAQSWDLNFAKECGDIVGAEMEAYGIDMWLAPALDIQRDIRCGRNFEYYSEDPLISGEMAAAVVNGVQKHPGKGAVIKHFAANNQETNRYASNSVVSEKALREIYLKGFEICIKKSHPSAIMTSYNLLNGIHTSENKHLLKDILKNEWGFNGIIMTDWIIRGMTDHASRYREPDAGLIMAAGGTLVMPGCRQDIEEILKALQDGRLNRKQLEENVCDLLRSMQYFYQK